MTLLCLFLFMSLNEEEGIFEFFSKEQNHVFSFEVKGNNQERKFKLVAESLRSNYGINILIENTANVEIKGNFSEVTLNEFLTYVCKTHGLTWEKTGKIYRFFKEKPPAYCIKIGYSKEKKLLSFDLKDAPIREVCVEIGKEIKKNILIDPGHMQKVTAFIQELPPLKALELALKPYGLSPVENPSHIDIVELEKESQSNITEKDQMLPGLEYNKGVFDGYLRAPDLENACRILGELGNEPIKILDTLEGPKIKLLIKALSLNEVLHSLFLGTPYSYKKYDDMTIIGSKSRNELTTSQIISLNHMNAQNVLAYLTGEGGTFETFSLPVRPSHFGNLYNQSRERMFGYQSSYRQKPMQESMPIKSIQRQNNQTMKAEFILAENVSAEITLIRERNSLLVTATQDVIDEIKKRISMIDKPVPQVLIQALVVDYTTDQQDKYGLSVQSGAFSYFPELDFTIEGNRDSNGHFQITRLPSNFSIRLQALAEEGKARIISKPHIATLSGHEAYIEVGVTQSFKITSENLVGSLSPERQVAERIETVEANISLRVVPWVSATGEITTYIEPVFNSFLGIVEDNVPPPISTRRLQSTVRLKNGETIILGGLIEEALRNNNKGIPGISRIPILGHLFKNQDRHFNKSELVIYLTPYVYYGNEGSAEIIKPLEGLKYPLDVREQKKSIQKKKKRWWQRKKK